MRFFHFLKKEMLHLIQAPEAIVLMIIFPIALTWVLGMALSSLTANTIDLPDMMVPVVVEDSPMADAFITEGKQAMIEFVRWSEEEASQALASGDHNTIVRIKGQDIQIETSDENSLEQSLVRMYASSFVNQANVFNYAVSQGRYDVFDSLEGNYVDNVGVDAKRAPQSFDYYGVTMLTLIMMYGSLQANSLFEIEQAGRTDQRLRVAPIPILQVLFVKVLASLIVLAVQTTIIIVFNTFVFKVEYGNPVNLFILLLFYGLFTTSFGVLVNQLTGKRQSAESIIQVMTVIFLATGGAYFMINENSGFFYTLQQFSPVGWINQAIFRTVYDGNLSTIVPTSLRFLGISLAMLLIAAWLYPKKGPAYASDR